MVGTNIKALRKERKLTQAELSTLLNIKQNTLSQYENEVNEPDLNTLVKIADIFKVSLDYLVGRYKQ